MTNVNPDMRTCDADKLYTVELNYRLPVGTIDNLMDQVVDILWDPATNLPIQPGISGNLKVKDITVSTIVETDEPEKVSRELASLISNALRDVKGLPIPEISFTKDDSEEHREFIAWLDRVNNEEEDE